MKTLILASSSPRRQELLAQLGHPFLIDPPIAEETPDPTLSPKELVQSLALAKGREVGQRHPHAIVIGADTVVVWENTVLGKPKDTTMAEEMITKLQGNSHTVLTAFALISKEKEFVQVVETKVTFRPLSPQEVRSYVAQGESLDKAGGYGIQGKAGCFVSEIHGDYFNVVGLPLSPLSLALGQFELPLFGNEGEH